MKSTTFRPFWKHPATLVVTALRIAVIFCTHVAGFRTNIPKDWLFSTSLTCFLVKPQYTLVHIREALAIQQLVHGKFADAYAAHPRIQLPPLLLAALTPLAKQQHAELYLALIGLLMDFLLACMLESIGRIVLFTNRVENVDKEEQEQSQLPQAIRPPYEQIFAISTKEGNEKSARSLVSMESCPRLSAQLYYYSPFTALSVTLYSCFQNLPGFFLVLSLHEVVRCGGSPTLSTFLLATASYLELHHVVFLIPMMLCSLDRSWRRGALLASSFCIWFGALQVLSYQLVGPSSFGKVLYASYGLGWKTIHPSLSVQWYFAMQIFSRFIGYFEILFLGLPYILVVPLAIRLYKYPIVLIALFSMIWTIFRSTETLFDANLALVFFLLCPRSLARTGVISFLSLCSIIVPVLLNVVDHWLWLGPNTGNANYIFFQCLAYNVFLSILLSQFCSASLQRDKALRLAAFERAEKEG